MSTPTLTDIPAEAEARAAATGSLLRLATAGSVDDGKSTLVGRLLFDSKSVLRDQLAAVEQVSLDRGLTSADLALLTDGLRAEREQGITIDVAYRFFATQRRRFVIADTPGHVQYTRNMATGASHADLAVVLIDARKGVISQTRRHTHILALLGVRHVVLAVNKMDLIGFDADRFMAISADFRSMAKRLGIADVQCIPVAARDGDNIFRASPRMPWYAGPSVMAHLESIDVTDGIDDRPFRFPVQWVNRPNADFRGYSGRVVSGTVRCGDAVVVHPSGRRSRISGIVTADGRLQQAVAGESVTLLLADEVDASRGDVLASGAPPIVADRIASHLIWLDDAAMQAGRRYLLKSGTSSTGAVISALKHRVCIDSMAQESAQTLEANEIGYADLTLDRPLVCDAYRDSRELGSFILIDPVNRRTVAAGLIDAPLRHATDVRWHTLDIDKSVRAGLKQQKPCVLWFTGLSGAGKSTIANLVDRRLCELGRHSALLDGDNLRHGINQDLGFAPEARVENIRRVSEIAALFVDAGLITLVSLISPFRADRDAARRRFADGEFIEVHVATPLATCEARDPKGLYKRARAGELSNFTGIDQPYEAPDRPEIAIDGATLSASDAADLIVSYLREQHYF